MYIIAFRCSILVILSAEVIIVNIQNNTIIVIIVILIPAPQTQQLHQRPLALTTRLYLPLCRQVCLIKCLINLSK